jgi:hypothetical protein
LPYPAIILQFSFPLHYIHASKLSYGRKPRKLKTGSAEVSTLKEIKNRKHTIYRSKIFHDKCCEPQETSIPSFGTPLPLGAHPECKYKV